MPDIRAGLTKAITLDASQRDLLEQAMWIGFGQENVTDALIRKKIEIGARSISLPKYARLALATTPLVDGVDPDSVPLSDSKVTLIPEEYGQPVSITSLASLTTGGIVDLHAGELVGINYAETMDQLAINALNASTNSYIIAGTAEGSVTAGQVFSSAFADYFYNKLARNNVRKVDGAYIAMTHEDVLTDARKDASWTDAMKYAKPEDLLKNEMGMFKGFRMIQNNRSTFADQTGAGTVDLYSTYFLGDNALGKAISLPGHLVAAEPTDSLRRVYTLGWYEVSQTKILDQDSVWVGKCASSAGANAA